MIVIIILLLIAGFLWWTISPLFITTVVEDELSPEIQALLEAQPIVDSGSITEQEPPIEITATSKGDPITTASLEEVSQQLAPENQEPSVVTSTAQGPFTIIDTPGHNASGVIRVIDTPSEGSLVRYENYKGTNGPDLYVYLAKDLDATDFVSLGKAKGNQGNINYTVPEDVDLDDYKYVMTWCRAFGVLFDYAPIN